MRGEGSSASPSGSTSDGEYEVFLSFHGEDTRKGFTDFLYTYLDGASIRTFRDNEGLHVGEEIGPELLKAIKGSKISIPIFSKSYASSKWCMLELAQMAQCQEKGGQKIIPIFYDVEPYEVRHQSGSYEEAFRQHRKKRFDEVVVQGWKKALEKVGQLKGFELKKETNGHEGKLVKKVVEEVLSKLKKNYTSVPDNLVGLDEHIKEMEVRLNVGSDGVRIVGIHGMGGLGKTTIAKVIYNKFCERFECCCFVDDVQENSQRNGIVNLQNQLLSKIQNKKITDIDNVSEGIDRIRDAIRGKKAFIVLDDMGEKSQFDSLAGSPDCFASGSRIIVTTRNQMVLVSLEEVNLQKGLIDVCRRYEPPFMKPDVSLQLFSKYAFMRDSPNEGYDSLAKDVVSVAAGLPLVLVTIGSLLFGMKEKDLWEEKVRELRDIPAQEVQRKLKISFDALTLEQKEIFLDIACLFIGFDKTYPCYVWDDLRFYPRNALNVLVQRSLIKIGDDNTFNMHDQLRDLGRYITREGGRCSRLWIQDEDLEVYISDQGVENIKSLNLDLLIDHTDLGRPIVGEKFVRLRNLWYLDLRGGYLAGDFKDCLPNLRWLEWRRPMLDAMRFRATNFCLRNLVILELLCGDVTEDSNFWTQIKMSKKLKVLQIDDCTYLTRVPSLSTFSNLERLNVVYCRYLRSLDGIEELESLKYLRAQGCLSLKTLPNLSRVRKLEVLNVSVCGLITEIPGLDKLESLECLDVSYCESLVRLPGLSNLKRLKTLDVSRCTKLIEIHGLEGLETLERLLMRTCHSIERLPDLSNLKSLQKLDVSACTSLETPLNLSELRELKELNVSNLQKLKGLDVSFCTKLTEIQGLDGLESLEFLDISYYDGKESVIDLSNLKRLRNLRASSCLNLIEIHGLEGLESLEYLFMPHCDSIIRLPDLPKLKCFIT